MKTMIRLFSILLVLWISTTQAEMRVECLEGCESPGANQSVNLLLRETESVPVVIRWATSENPQAEGRILTLYAGNPTIQAAIPDRGALTFSAVTQGGWEATRQFSGTELGRGTFLTVVTQRPQGSERDASGKNESIVDWRAFRLLTMAEQQRKEQGPPPGGDWSVIVTPALLKASSGDRKLPPARGGDKQAWWSLAEMEGDTSNLDLDGEQNGFSGLTIQVSTPWHSSATENWKQTVQQKITGVNGHQVRFGDLKWQEQPDRTNALGADKRPRTIRYYYTVVTLFTNATIKSFDDKEVGANWFVKTLVSPTYFSHETSARLKHPDDPRFWASYSRREYSADQRLLSMLHRHVAQVGTVPGLGMVQQDDGDGGAATYTAGFYATVRPWESQAGRGEPRAGFIGLDVVAARAGIGGLLTEGSAGTSSIDRIWCQVIRCGTSGHALDLDKPPSGYQVTQPVASLATLSGALPRIQEPPELAEKGIPSEDELPALPTSVRFGLSANLRSGALLQEASWGHIQNIVPINTYAQFVVKMTVAMVPDTNMVTNDERNMPLLVELATSIAVPKPTDFWAWLTDYPILWIAALTGGVALLLVFVPGGITVVRSIMGVVTQALQLLVDVIALLLKKLSALVHRKPGD